MQHMKSEIHGCIGLREQVILMDLNARVDMNYGRKDGGIDRRRDGHELWTERRRDG